MLVIGKVCYLQTRRNANTNLYISTIRLLGVYYLDISLLAITLACKLTMQALTAFVVDNKVCYMNHYVRTTGFDLSMVYFDSTNQMLGRVKIEDGSVIIMIYIHEQLREYSHDNNKTTLPLKSSCIFLSMQFYIQCQTTEIIEGYKKHGTKAEVRSYVPCSFMRFLSKLL